MEPQNNGDSINSSLLSFVERLSFIRDSQCIKTIGRVFFGSLSNVLYREVYGGSTVRGSTVRVNDMFKVAYL